MSQNEQEDEQNLQDDTSLSDSEESEQSQKQIEDMDSDEKEKMLKSYEEYGKLLKINKIQKKIETINKSQKVHKENDMIQKSVKKTQKSGSSYGSSVDGQDYLSSRNSQNQEAYQGNKKNSRSYSLPPQNPDEIQQKQIQLLKQINILKCRQNRINSIGVLKESDLKNIRDIQKLMKPMIKEERIDELLFQLEEERQEIHFEIQQIINQSCTSQNKKQFQMDQFQQGKENKNQLIKKLSQMDIDFEEERIINMDFKDIIFLNEIVENYNNIVINKQKYENIENLENESNSEPDELSEDQQNDQDQYLQSNRNQQKSQQKQQNFQQNVSKNINNQKNINFLFKQYEQSQKNQNLSEINSSQKVLSENQIKQSSKHSIQMNDEMDQKEIDSDSKESGKQQSKSRSQTELQQSSVEIKKNPSIDSIDSKENKIPTQQFQIKKMDSFKSLQSFKSKGSGSGGRFLMDSVSDRSTIKRSDSIFRKDRLRSLELDYNNYLQQHQGIFVIKCQMMNIEYAQIQEKYDLQQMMKKFKNFKKLQNEIQQNEVYNGLQTIVIDIENTLITQVDIKSKQEFDQLKEQENFLNYYIVIKKNNGKKKLLQAINEEQKQQDENSKTQNIEEPKQCCQFQNTPECICKLLVYQVRPYTFEFLRAIQPFFEIVIFTKMHHKILEHIVDHIESVLNRPIRELMNKYIHTQNNSSFQRMRKLPDIKIYFQYIIHQKQYIQIKEHDKFIENLLVLTKNRLKENLIFMTSNPFRIIAAMKGGFLVIPVLQFEQFYRDEFQLCLVEHYILKIRHLKDMRKRIKQDFKYFLQKIEKQPPRLSQQNINIQYQKNDTQNKRNLYKKDSFGGGSQKSLNCFELASQGSFGMKKFKIEKEDDEIELEKEQDQINTKSQFKPSSSFRPRKLSLGQISYGSEKKFKIILSQEQIKEQLEEDHQDEEDIKLQKQQPINSSMIQFQNKLGRLLDPKSIPKSQNNDASQSNKNLRSNSIQSSANISSETEKSNNQNDHSIKMEDIKPYQDSQKLQDILSHQKNFSFGASNESVKVQGEQKENNNEIIYFSINPQLSKDITIQDQIPLNYQQDEKSLQNNQAQQQVKSQQEVIQSISRSESGSQGDKKSQESLYNQIVKNSSNSSNDKAIFREGRIVYDASCVILEEESKSQIDLSQQVNLMSLSSKSNQRKESSNGQQQKKMHQGFGSQLAESLNENQFNDIEKEMEINVKI